MNIRTKKIIYLYKIANNENKDSLNILNENILDIQNHLIAAGYELPTHGADGLLGPETYRALLDFKRDNNLPETKELSEDELNILKSKKKDNKLNNFKTKNINSNTLLFGDSQMQGGIGKVLEAKYGGKRLYKPGSTASYWVSNQELSSELEKRPGKIIIQLNSNGISGTSKLIEKIKTLTPDSEIIWYGAPPAILKENSTYKQVTNLSSLAEFNNNRKMLNKEVAGMLSASGLNAKLIDPYTSIFNSSDGQAYSCNNCDGIHIPYSIAQKFYA